MPKELLRNQMHWSFRRERLSAQTSHSSEDDRASGKPAALFSQERNEQRNQMWSSVLGNANLSNLSGTLLARSDVAKRELHVESLNKCIGDLQTRTEAQNRAPQDVQYKFVESRREQTRLQEELLRKEKALRDTQQVQQVDGFSMQKLGENHEIIQKLTSQLQQMREQMHSMNGSGDFQDIE